jgi:hypothetical protein
LTVSAKWYGALVATVVVITVGACGGGGGGGGGTTAPPPPVRMLSWSADAAPGSQTVYLDIRDLSTPDEFILQVRVNDVDDLYGVALDVVYPSSAMQFQAMDTDVGEFFRAGGTIDTELLIVEEPVGRIIIGYTRLGEVRGRNGNGLLLLLRFTTTANGSSDISIENRLAVDRDGIPLATTWLGGTVQVQR